MKYYAMIDGVRKGPFELEELPEAGVRPSTYIWHKGLQDWIKAEEDADICRLFRNRLYDIMHPAPAVPADPDLTPDFQNKDQTSGAPTRFDRFIQDSGEQLPTIEEIESRQNTSVPPMSMIGYAWLVTFVGFFPAGIVALIYAYKSKKAWNKGLSAESYDYCRLSKMWIGISFFIGLMFFAFLLAFI